MDQVIVSVIMPVYNTKEEFLREAIESILNQTFRDFEFIIVDDASLKDTKDVICSYDDERIILLTNEKNQGVTRSLNKGLGVARGKYVARMDSDDISFPDRLEKQVSFFDKNPMTEILGSYVCDGDKTRLEYSRVTQKERKTLFLLENVGPIHPSVMIKKSFLDKNNIRYNEGYPVAQDYELWVRCNDLTDIQLYPEVLLIRRKHSEQIGRTNNTLQHAMAARIKTEQMAPLLDGVYSNEHIYKSVLSLTDGGESYSNLCALMKKLKKCACKGFQYDKKALKYVVSAYKIIYLRNNCSVLKRRFFQFGLLLSGDLIVFYNFRAKHIMTGEH